MNIVVGVGVPRLQGENRGVGGCVQLHHGLHGQGAVDEVGRFVVDIPHVDDHPLVVGICTGENTGSGTDFRRGHVGRFEHVDAINALLGGGLRENQKILNH